MSGSRLRVEIVALEPPMEGSELILGVGEIQKIAGRVATQNCEDCRLELEADASIFEVVSGAPSVDLGSGSFEKIVDWSVRAATPSVDAALGIWAFARGLQQHVSLAVRIHPMPRIEDE